MRASTMTASTLLGRIATMSCGEKRCCCSGCGAVPEAAPCCGGKPFCAQLEKAQPRQADSSR